MCLAILLTFQLVFYAVSKKLIRPPLWYEETNKGMLETKDDPQVSAWLPHRGSHRKGIHHDNVRWENHCDHASHSAPKFDPLEFTMCLLVAFSLFVH